ncbi:MAG: TonB-dependent receptor [Alphaproteobacteria bacterium]|nr:TonB-dependent receptor [Alphaproteobacteria bacterium]
MLVRRKLSISASIVALSVSGFVAGTSALAQPSEPPPGPSAQSQPGEQASKGPVEKVVVTGTRLKNPGLVSPNPITSIGADSIQSSGEINVTNIVERYPALIGSLDPKSTTNVGAVGISGLNQLNLRNLGTNRTLVLVNGRRHVGSLAGDTGVDVNSIPIDLIERVDVLTGGSSAIYGADAVTGVVNFVMRRRLDGTLVRVQVGGSDQGDLGQYLGSVATGTSFDEGRGNLLGAYEFRRSDELDPLDRDASNQNAFFLVRNPAERAIPGDDPNLPDRIFARNVGWPDSAPSGVITGNEWLLHGFDLESSAPDQIAGFTNPLVPKQAYLGTGELWDPGIHVGNRQIGGNTTKLHTYNGLIEPKQEVSSFNLIGDYEFSRMIRLFGEAKFVHNDSTTGYQPTFDFGLPIRASNPFVPAAILANLAPIAAADLGTTEDFYFSTRDNFDLGMRGDHTTRKTYRGVLGIDGELTDDLGYELSYTFGRTDVLQIDLNNRITDRFLAATDVVLDGGGHPICRSDLFPADPLPEIFGSVPFGISFTPGPGSGCVPINIFDPNPKSAAALAWIMTNTPTKSRLDQQVVSGFLSYDTQSWFSLPGGGIGIVAGGEWRREESSNTPDPILLSGNTFGNALSPSAGSYEVRESFAEVNLPILKEVPFAYDLSVNGAVRSSQYSTAGDNLSWKYGGSWAPVQDVRLRSTVSRAVRAPNIGELFSPEQQSFFQPNDPCDQSNVTQGSSTRLANCIAALSALGVSTAPYNFDGNLTSSFPGVQKGNTHLQEETADTITIGVVLTPTFLKGFSAVVDYWTVEIRDGILTPSSQDAVDACYDAPSLANVFCAALSRIDATEVTPATQLGQLDALTVQAVNIASFESTGIDFEVNYRFELTDLLGPDTDLGSMRASVVGSKLEQLDLVTLQGGATDDDAGEALTLLGGSAPEWVVNLGLQWEFKEWTVGYAFRWQSEILAVEKLSLANDPDQRDITTIGTLHVHDVVVRYQANDAIELYAGINNLFDQEPDIGQTVLPIGPDGRTVFFGMKASLGSAFE